MYILCCIKNNSPFVTAYSVLCLVDVWSEAKEDIVCMSWLTRNDSLPCD